MQDDHKAVTEEKTARYHHGDLRQALILAGLEILESEGVDALTLRKIAARAGVSHAAPAHHFATLKDLLSALAVIAFQRFEATMAEEMAATDPDPVSQLQAAGHGYTRFARDNPGMFRLMFSSSRLDRGHADLLEIGLASRRNLSRIARPFASHHGLTDENDMMQLDIYVWSIVHGFAHLQIDGRIPPTARLPNFANLLATGSLK